MKTCGQECPQIDGLSRSVQDACLWVGSQFCQGILRKCDWCYYNVLYTQVYEVGPYIKSTKVGRSWSG